MNLLLNIKRNTQKTIKITFYLLILFWTIVLSLSLWFNINNTYDHARETIRVYARTAFDKDVAYRAWAARLHGLYTPITAATPPNPYLTSSDRDLTSTTGVELTKVNPAYMARLVYELEALNSDVRRHITSKMPLRPENMPSEWEADALTLFENGLAEEVIDFDIIDNQRYMLFMKPLFIEESCMGCHAAQGYELGDVRGGISIFLPTQPVMSGILHSVNMLKLSHFLVWFLGMSLFALGARIMSNNEKRIVKAKEEAEYANGAKNDFLAHMSHEIRTPLNGVLGMTDVLMRMQLTTNQSSIVAVIKSSGDALLSVLNDVLDLSKIEAGKIYLNPVPFSLHDVLSDSVRCLTSLAHKKKLELIVNIDKDVPDSLIGDTIRIRQILLNLLSNAIKFTEKGEIILSFSNLYEDNDSVKLRISVTDTGIGVLPEKQISIFSAFEQADTSTTRKYGGTGLGLPICSRLVELMGSTLCLDSQYGVGSTFWFDLSLSLSDHASVVKPSLSIEKLKGVRVLAIDDNKTNLRVLTEQLQAWDMEVEQATSVDEAMGLLIVAADKQEEFALVLTDFQMPEKDGLDLFKEMQGDSSLKEIPVLILSLGGWELVDNPLMETTLLTKLEKPVLPLELMRAIACALELLKSCNINNIQQNIAEDTRKSSKSLKILLADDMEINQIVGSCMLKDLGHTIAIAHDGQQVLDMLLIEDFDLLLLDIQMPIMNGEEAAKIIREKEAKNPSGRHLAIVAMTANALKGDKEKYIAIGMDDYLPKPLRLKELIDAIEKVIESPYYISK